MDKTPKPCKLYTIYRTKDDALMVFEQPIEKAAAIMGVKESTIRENLSKQRRGVYKKPLYQIYATEAGEGYEDI